MDGGGGGWWAKLPLLLTCTMGSRSFNEETKLNRPLIGEEGGPCRAQVTSILVKGRFSVLR